MVEPADAATLGKFAARVGWPLEPVAGNPANVNEAAHRSCVVSILRIRNQENEVMTTGCPN